jgi:hypothetical protein
MRDNWEGAGRNTATPHADGTELTYLIVGVACELSTRAPGLLWDAAEPLLSVRLARFEAGPCFASGRLFGVGLLLSSGSNQLTVTSL